MKVIIETTPKWHIYNNELNDLMLIVDNLNKLDIDDMEGVAKLMSLFNSATSNFYIGRGGSHVWVHEQVNGGITNNRILLAF